MRIGVLGGTFDPPHLAHLVLAAAARRALHLDRVLFVPAGQPWRKADRGVTPAEVRVRMVEAAIAPLSWAALSRIEVEGRGPSYAAETMEALVSQGGPADEWWFIVGADALADLPRWHEPERLLAAVRLALAARPSEAQSVPAEVLARLPHIEARIDRVPMPPLAISSTDLRVRVRDGRPTTALLPEVVRAILGAAGLYRGA